MPHDAHTVCSVCCLLNQIHPVSDLNRKMNVIVDFISLCLLLTDLHWSLSSISEPHREYHVAVISLN